MTGGGLLYGGLRALARIALRLFYRQIESVGTERIPDTGPVLLIVNHPNALVDALVVGTVVPRRVFLTAKGTLFRNGLLAKFLRTVGVVPLQRARDLQPGERPDPSRNLEAFRAILQTLAAGRAVLIFPEGISHDEPSMAPLRTGAARLALQARDDAGVRGLQIVPIGLTFSRKDAPRSRVLAEVGDPILMDEWAPASGLPVEALTAEMTRRLRAVTLNFASLDHAAQATALATMIAGLLARRASSLGRGGPRLRAATAIARQIEELRARLPALDVTTRDRVLRFAADVESFRERLREHGLRADDLAIARDATAGVRFVTREGWIIALAVPAALWGTLNHWLPFRIARAIATHSPASAADPAMRTIVAGGALVLITYAIQGIVVARWLGPVAAALYLLSLPIAARINLRYRERLRRAVRRARTYLRFRRDPAFQQSLLDQASALREEAQALGTLLQVEADTASVATGSAASPAREVADPGS